MNQGQYQGVSCRRKNWRLLWCRHPACAAQAIEKQAGSLHHKGCQCDFSMRAQFSHGSKFQCPSARAGSPGHSFSSEGRWPFPRGFTSRLNYKYSFNPALVLALSGPCGRSGTKIALRRPYRPYHGCQDTPVQACNRGSKACNRACPGAGSTPTLSAL